MTWRGGVVVALLLALGLGGGYATSALWSARTATTGRMAEPVPASPSYPVDPDPVVRPDPDLPPLPTDLEFHYERLGVEGFEVEVPVPNGWSKDISEAIEIKWKNKGYPPWTYVLRVERVAGQTQSIPSMLAERIVDLEDDPRIRNINFIERAQLHGDPSDPADTLGFTYVSEGYRRYGFVTWVDVAGSGNAEIEVAVTGRERDIPGLRALLTNVAEGLRPVGG